MEINLDYDFNGSSFESLKIFDTNSQADRFQKLTLFHSSNYLLKSRLDEN